MNSDMAPSGEESGFVMVTTTAGDLTEGHRLADALVDRRLAACVQISPISSVYLWRGRIETEPEVRLVVKTRRALYPAVEQALRELHSYETPQIVVTDITGGSSDYLAWIDASTQPE